MTENNPEPEITEPLAQPPLREETPDDYKDKYLRLLAELENTRKRMQKEKQEATRYGIENVLTDILTPMDNLENALQFTEQMSQEVKNWALGFQMILSQFRDVLQENGVSSFKSEGELFDPHKHEAVESEYNDTFPEGIILKEYVKGYRCGDRTIRVARVKVNINKEIKEGE